MDNTQMFLDAVRDIIIKKDYDWIDIITGPEGVGKTSLAANKCRYIDPTFRLDKDTAFSYDDMVRMIKKSYPGKAVLIDEGALIFFSRDYAGTSTKDAVKMLTTMRAFNLFVAICIPNFWIIDKYIREHRGRTLSRVIHRGWYWHYGPRKTRNLSREKESFKTEWPNYDFRDTYPDYAKLYPDEWQRYKKLKEDSTLRKVRTKRDDPVPMACWSCGWQWTFTGKRKTATCPSCENKVKVPELEI